MCVCGRVCVFCVRVPLFRDAEAMRRGEKILPRFWKFYLKIVDTCNDGCNVLIHCRAGAHRAGTASAGFGMRCFHYTAKEAVRWVREGRRVTHVDGDDYWLLLGLEREIAEATAGVPPQAVGEARDWGAEPAAPAADPATPDRASGEALMRWQTSPGRAKPS